MHIVQGITLVFMMGIIHRYRGTSYPLPIKNVWWVWPAVFLLLLSLGVLWPVALTWALGWLVWSLPGWMRVISKSCGIVDDAWGRGRPLTWDERMIETLSKGDAYWGIFLRGFIWLVPMSLALLLQHQRAWPVWIVALVFPWAYRVGQKTVKDGDIAKVGEFIVGMSWGLAMTLSLWG